MKYQSFPKTSVCAIIVNKIRSPELLILKVTEDFDQEQRKQENEL